MGDVKHYPSPCAIINNSRSSNAISIITLLPLININIIIIIPVREGVKSELLVLMDGI